MSNNGEWLIKNNITKLEDILEMSEIPILYTPQLLDDDTWKASKTFLTNMSIGNLEGLAKYYSLIKQVNIYIEIARRNSLKVDPQALPDVSLALQQSETFVQVLRAISHST